MREADVEEGCRAIGFTLGTPGPSQLGVVDGILVDRAFVEDRQKNAQELAEVSDVNPPAPHNIANALAAAALARAFGVPASGRTGRAAGLHARTPTASRTWPTWTGSPTSTTPRPPTPTRRKPRWRRTSPIVWIAGGLAKGATFDELVAKSAKRLRGVVLIGADRALIREALARHAPEVPVVDLDRTDTGAMLAAVQEAQRLAARATRCCWPRPVPRWTCSPTTTSAVTRSRRRFANSAPDPAAAAAAWMPRGPGPGRDTEATYAERRVSGSRTGGARRPAPAGGPRHPAHRAGRACVRPLHARAPGLGPAADRLLPDPRRQSADHRARPGDGLLGLPDHGPADVAAGLLLLPQAVPRRRHRRRCCCWSPRGCR